MAKVKSKKDAQVAQNEVNEETVTETVAATEPEVNENEAAEEAIDQVEKEIPEYVDNLLKTFSNYDELYVNSKCGVYTKDTPKSLIGDSKLYKNPYFKN